MRAVLQRLIGGETLSSIEAEECFGRIMDGAVSDAEIAALVTAMRFRGETVAEVTGAAQAMRARMVRVEAPAGAIDVCGTGGDGANTRNISSAVTFVLAGMGIPVAKHGNRGATSKSGAADVLDRLGIGLNAPAEAFPDIIGAANCAFLFAPLHHPALRHAGPVRRALGFRTIFNMLGPLCNPASVRRQLIGVYDPTLGAVMASVLAELGGEKAWLAHSEGLDEFSVAGPTLVTEQLRRAVASFIAQPNDAGLPLSPLTDLTGGDPDENAQALQALLDGRMQSPADLAYRNTVLLNAAAGAVVADRAASLREGMALATAALDGGAAKTALIRLQEATSRWKV